MTEVVESVAVGPRSLAADLALILGPPLTAEQRITNAFNRHDPRWQGPMPLPRFWPINPNAKETY